jgi:hypothetical protein
MFSLKKCCKSCTRVMSSVVQQLFIQTVWELVIFFLHLLYTNGLSFFLSFFHFFFLPKSEDDYLNIKRCTLKKEKEKMIPTYIAVFVAINVIKTKSWFLIFLLCIKKGVLSWYLEIYVTLLQIPRSSESMWMQCIVSVSFGQIG